MLCVALIFYKNLRIENDLLRREFFSLRFYKLYFSLQYNNIKNVKIFITIFAASKVAFIILNIISFKLFY